MIPQGNPPRGENAMSRIEELNEILAELSHRFIDWAEDLECGLDLMSATYTIPG